MRVGIVGAGISGLALGEALSSRGVEVTLWDAADRAGGRIASREVDGYLLESGPNAFLDRAPETLALIERLGLSPSLRRAEPSAKRRWLWLRGKLREVPTTPPAFLRSDILPPLAKLRVLLEPLSRRARAEDESIAEFGRRHLGARASRDLLSGMVVGIFAGRAERLSLPSCFPRMAALEREHRSLILALLRSRRAQRSGGPAGPGGTLATLDGGLETLTRALAAQLGDALHLGTEVRGIERRGEAYVVQAGDGEVEVDRLVLATPTEASMRLLRPLAPEAIPPMESIPYAPMSVVHLGWEEAALERPVEGFGFLIPPHEGRDILGAILVSSIFPWRAPEGRRLFTVMVGGSIRPELPALGDDELVGLASRELSEILGLRGDPVFSKVVRWERAIPQYEVGHGERVRAVEAALAEHPGLYVAGDAFRGVGINDCISDATALAERISAGG